MSDYVPSPTIVPSVGALIGDVLIVFLSLTAVVIAVLLLVKRTLPSVLWMLASVIVTLLLLDLGLLVSVDVGELTDPRRLSSIAAC